MQSCSHWIHGKSMVSGSCVSQRLAVSELGKHTHTPIWKISCFAVNLPTAILSPPFCIQTPEANFFFKKKPLLFWTGMSWLWVGREQSVDYYLDNWIGRRGRGEEFCWRFCVVGIENAQQLLLFEQLFLVKRKEESHAVLILLISLVDHMNKPVPELHGRHLIPHQYMVLCFVFTSLWAWIFRGDFQLVLLLAVLWCISPQICQPTSPARKPVQCGRCSLSSLPNKPM